MRIGKKGLSDVIATVLIIMLTVVAIAIIAGFVIPFVTNNLNSAGECVQYKNYFEFQKSLGYKSFNCYNDVSKLHGASVGALNSGEITDLNMNNTNSANLDLVFINTSNSESVKVEIRKGKATSSAVGGVRMLNASIGILKVPQNGGIQTYVYSSNMIYDAVEVYPVLKNGRVCDKNDRITLSKCGVSLYV